MATILLVDDDVGTRDILEKMLVRDGHKVSVAGDGGVALRLIASTDFDLMITDIVMPDVEGMEVLNALRKKAKRPRIIAMSGGGRGSAEDYLTMAKKLGADATLKKPFAPEDLAHAMRQVLGEA